MKQATRTLVDALHELKGDLLLVVTGAGTSHASGLPTFRGHDPGAVWRQSDISVATFAYFLNDPVGHWSWYINRFKAMQTAAPNPAHESLAWLQSWHEERGGRFLLVTQNIDLLHEAAGSRDPIKVHGTVARVRCSVDGCINGAPSGSMPRDAVDFEVFERQPALANIPTCPECGALVRVHVLLFDEYYTGHADYRYDEVERAAYEADSMLFIGTSFSVGVTDLLLRAGIERGVPMFSIDPTERDIPFPTTLVPLTAPAEKLLPAVQQELSRTAH